MVSVFNERNGSGCAKDRVTSYVIAAGCAAALRTGEIRKQRSLQGLFLNRRLSRGVHGGVFFREMQDGV